MNLTTNKLRFRFIFNGNKILNSFNIRQNLCTASVPYTYK